MPRIAKPFEHAPRNDTLSVRTRVHHDRDARRPTTPILIGTTVVMRRPLPNSIYTEYLIMDGNQVARTQISMPSIDDCKTALSASKRERDAAKSTADGAIAKAKRGTRSKKSEVPV
ncbi:beta-hexosaminidase [Burkholderia gladioli]|uniref:beta-hexosaminidase n=1 Tax=Burkholderia gladioli TaxID=28095 RepID=UPI00163EA3C1|nr:beta-hexosaminidase [Burkholderia gladioli]